MRAALFATALLLLAGCGSKAGSPADPTLAAGDLPLLQGYVFDQAVRPVGNANVTITGVGVSGRNATAATGADGHYAFAALPVEQRLVVTVQAPGLKALSKQVALSTGNSTMLNFTLEPIPAQKPYNEPIGFNGFLSCEGAVAASTDDTQRFDCGGTTNHRVWVFNVNPGVKGIVLETKWTSTSPASDYLHVLIETVGLGDQNAPLAEVTGASVMRAQVSQAQCEKYFPQGGTLQVTWFADPNADEQETGVGAAFTVQQDFKAVATSFYVNPPPPDFSSE